MFGDKNGMKLSPNRKRFRERRQDSSRPSRQVVQAPQRSLSIRGMLTPRREGLLAELRVEAGEERVLGFRERTLRKHRGPAPEVGMARLACEHQPRPLAGFP